MTCEWILLEHSSQLGAGREPATSIVDVVDPVEIVSRGFRRGLTVTEDSSTVDTVVQSSKILDHISYKGVHEIFGADVAGNRQYLNLWMMFRYGLFRLLQELLIQISDCDPKTTSISKPLCNRCSYAWWLLVCSPYTSRRLKITYPSQLHRSPKPHRETMLIQPFVLFFIRAEQMMSCQSLSAS